MWDQGSNFATFWDQGSKFGAKNWDQRWKNIPGYDPGIRECSLSIFLTVSATQNLKRR